MITHVKCDESKGAREAVMELLKQLHLAEYSQMLGGKPYFSNSYRSQWDRHGMSNVQKLCAFTLPPIHACQLSLSKYRKLDTRCWSFSPKKSAGSSTHSPRRHPKHESAPGKSLRGSPRCRHERARRVTCPLDRREEGCSS